MSDSKRRGRRLGLERVRVALDTGTETLTQQQFAVEADINTIVKRFGLGQPVPQKYGVYGDFSGITDYRSAVAAIEKADEAFMALPAEVRDRFANDPQRLLEYADRVSEDELQAVFKARPKDPIPVPVESVVPSAPPEVPVPKA